MGIPRNEFKDGEKTQIMVFGIEIDTSTFIARLPAEKLDKAVKAIAKILAEKSVSLLKIQSLIEFLSFCFQAVCLDRVFMRRLWDFINQFPWAGSKVMRRKIPAYMRKDLK